MVVFEAVGSAPSANLAHVLRWYNHILSYGNDSAGFTGVKKPVSAYGSLSTVAKPSNADDDDDDDDDDLFGSDTEEDKVFRKSTQVLKILESTSIWLHSQKRATWSKSSITKPISECVRITCSNFMITNPLQIVNRLAASCELHAGLMQVVS